MKISTKEMEMVLASRKSETTARRPANLDKIVMDSDPSAKRLNKVATEIARRLATNSLDGRTAYNAAAFIQDCATMGIVEKRNTVGIVKRLRNFADGYEKLFKGTDKISKMATDLAAIVA